MSAAFLSSTSSTMRRAMSSGGRSSAGTGRGATAALAAASRLGRPSGRGAVAVALADDSSPVGPTSGTDWSRWVFLHGFWVTIQPIGRDDLRDARRDEPSRSAGGRAAPDR